VIDSRLPPPPKVSSFSSHRAYGSAGSALPGWIIRHFRLFLSPTQTVIMLLPSDRGKTCFKSSLTHDTGPGVVPPSPSSAVFSPLQSSSFTPRRMAAVPTSDPASHAREDGGAAARPRLLPSLGSLQTRRFTRTPWSFFPNSAASQTGSCTLCLIIDC